MGTIRALLSRLNGSLNKQRRERELAEEFESHLAMQIEDNLRAGISPEQARREALLKSGGLETSTESCRDRRGLPLIETIARDFAYAMRQVRKSPGFAAVVVLTLALGIGANTAVFSLLYGVLLRPPPYPAQGRLVFIQESSKEAPSTSVNYPNFVIWREQQRSFTAIGVACPWQFSYAGPNDAERLNGAVASHDLFAAIGVAPLRGRLFTAEDDKPGAERKVVLRASLWRHLFGGRDSVIGEKTKLSGEFHTAVGVLPDNFRVPLEGAELWTAISHSISSEELQHGYRSDGLDAYARLKPGISIESARSDMRTVAARLEWENYSGGFVPTLLPFATAGAGEVSLTLYVLLGAAGFVLLIACANVASLQLARAHARSKEFAVRAALGSGRMRIARQLLIESLILGLLGCGAGVLLG